MVRAIAAVYLAATLTACTTPYQPAGFGGGFTETQIQDNVFRVSFTGNGVTKPEQAEEMALLRCAELMLQRGFNHFVLIDGRSRVDSSMFTTPVQAVTTGTISTKGDTARLNAKTRYTGGDVIVVDTPSTTNTVMGFKDRPAPPIVAFDARLVYDSLAPRYIKK